MITATRDDGKTVTRNSSFFKELGTGTGSPEPQPSSEPVTVAHPTAPTAGTSTRLARARRPPQGLDDYDRF